MLDTLQLGYFITVYIMCCFLFFSYHYLMSMLLNGTITQYQHYSWDHISCG